MLSCVLCGRGPRTITEALALRPYGERKFTVCDPDFHLPRSMIGAGITIDRDGRLPVAFPRLYESRRNCEIRPVAETGR